MSTTLAKNLTTNFHAHSVLELKLRGIEARTLNQSEWQPRTSFAIVRHPLTRLLSAYKDKVARVVYSNDTHFKNLMLLRRQVRTALYGKRNGSRTNETISLQDFVKFVTSEDNRASMWQHWRPQIQAFNPCFQRSV